MAMSLGPDDVDFLELRVDALVGHLDTVRRTLPKLRLPVLLTVRHPDEGGIGKLSLARRTRLFVEFLPYAALVDVELRSADSLGGVLSSARERGVKVIVSEHYFRSAPTLTRMLERQRRAFAAGADFFKIAALTDDARSLARLLELASRRAPGPRSMMGMGRLGQVSRLTLACAGSVLNYGFLDKPNAPGQWEALELKRVLARLGV
jgi:3-dehydroquinate dehydratase-1